MQRMLELWKIKQFHGDDTLILAACQMNVHYIQIHHHNESTVWHKIEMQLLFCGRDEQQSSTLLDRLR